MKKLSAFTLIELLVAMIVSGIVVSASYFCFSAVTRQMNGFKSSTDKTMDVALLKMLIENDAHLFPFMKNESDYELEFSGKDENKINYTFGNNFILREQNKTIDTIHVKTREVKMLFEKKIPEQRHSLVDEITFDIRLPDSTYKMHFIKEYAPDVLMNEEEQKGL